MILHDDFHNLYIYIFFLLIYEDSDLDPDPGKTTKKNISNSRPLLAVWLMFHRHFCQGPRLIMHRGKAAGLQSKGDALRPLIEGFDGANGQQSSGSQQQMDDVFLATLAAVVEDM